MTNYENLFITAMIVWPFVTLFLMCWTYMKGVEHGQKGRNRVS